jgi:hypothetical protein
MLRKNRRFVSALLAGAALLRAGVGMADTITVHDLSQNTATQTDTYTIQLDSAANVHTNDGFVIYDFPALSSWSISGGLSSSEFVLTQTLTSNTLNQSSFVDAFGSVAASSNGLSFDNPAVENLSFSYVGPPVPFLGATTAVLSLTSTGASLHGLTDSVYASVDHSGSSSSNPFSYASNPIIVPAPGNAEPLPAASFSGAVLIGLLALGRTFKARRLEA